MPESTEELTAKLLRRWGQIEALRLAVVTDGKATKVWPDDPELQAWIDSPAGKAEVGRWLAAFAETLSLLRVFRDRLVHGTESPSAEDLTLALKSADQAVSALADRGRQQVAAAA